jgi:hypothetical protein
MPKSLSTLEIRVKLADVGLVGFARGCVSWEGDHVRIVLLRRDSTGLTKEVVSQISACLRKIGCRCVLDEVSKVIGKKKMHEVIPCVNRFSQLAVDHVPSDGVTEVEPVDVTAVSTKMKEVQGERKLRIATWNFSGLSSERKQKEVSEILNRLKLDIVAGQESWEKEGTSISVDGYKWFGKPRSNQNSLRGEGGVGFLVRECLVEEVEFVSSVRYEESVWMKVRGGRGREALYICCVYMPTDSSSVSAIEGCYEKLKEDVLGFKEREE